MSVRRSPLSGKIAQKAENTADCGRKSPALSKSFPQKIFPKLEKDGILELPKNGNSNIPFFWTKVDGKTKTEGFIVKNKCIRIIFHRAICAENVADKP